MNLSTTPYREVAESLQEIAAMVRCNRDMRIRFYEEDHRFDYQESLRRF